MIYYYHERNDMEDEREYKPIELIADDVETLKQNYIILLEYVKKLEAKNRMLQYQKDKPFTGTMFAQDAFLKVALNKSDKAAPKTPANPVPELQPET